MIQLMKTKREAGSLGPAEDERLRAHERNVKLDRERLAIVAEFEPRFAQIYCTSGVKSSYDGDASEKQEKRSWLLDWGLAELCPHRVQTFQNLSSVSLTLRSPANYCPQT